MYQWEREFKLGVNFLALAILLWLGVPKIIAFCIVGCLFLIGLHQRTVELIRMEGKIVARNVTYVPDHHMLRCIATAVVATYSLSIALVSLWLAALIS